MSEEGKLTRRQILAAGITGGAALALGQRLSLGLPPMPERPLGRTGHRVRLFSLGGQATLEQPGSRDLAVEIIHRALDLGVNYVDTAAAYGRGLSQSYIGEVMEERRDEVFLASKTHDRTRDGSLRLLEESLRLLRTDHLDLWQLHNVRLQEQVDRIFADDGALQALLQARDEGMVRFLGITGHYDPAPLIDALDRFEFDAILMALNPADPHHLPFRDALLPLAVRRQMGVIGMKIPARGRLFRPGGVDSMRAAMTWTLTQPVSTVIVGCDTVEQLEENVEIAAGFAPLTPTEAERIEALTADYADEASFFKRDAAGWDRGEIDDQNTA